MQIKKEDKNKTKISQNLNQVERKKSKNKKNT